MRRARSIWLLSVITAVAMASCGGSDETPGGGATTPAGGGTAQTTVAVILQEFALLPAQASAPANTVTFVAENKGPKLEHELVVVKTALDPGALPKKADGTVDEEGAGVQAIGEIEEIAVGKTAQRTFQLEVGKYVLFCNLIDTTQTPARPHYGLGMFAGFTVT